MAITSANQLELLQTAEAAGGDALMSSTLQTLASKLAKEPLALQRQTGEDRLYMEVGKVLGQSSQTLEEAFLTEVRVS